MVVSGFVPSGVEADGEVLVSVLPSAGDPQPVTSAPTIRLAVISSMDFFMFLLDFLCLELGLLNPVPGVTTVPTREGFPLFLAATKSAEHVKRTYIYANI